MAGSLKWHRKPQYDMSLLLCGPRIADTLSLGHRLEQLRIPCDLRVVGATESHSGQHHDTTHYDTMNYTTHEGPDALSVHVHGHSGERAERLARAEDEERDLDAAGEDDAVREERRAPNPRRPC